LINVAFWYDRPQEYTGGLNYIKNLLVAISLAQDTRIRPYIFVGKNVDVALVEQLQPLATVVQTSVLDRGTAAWFVHKVLFKLLNRQWMVNRLMRKYRIQVVSHAEHVYGRGLPFRLISWIPDFQYLHLPELFPGLDVAAESRRWSKIAAHSDAVVLSSHAALNDFKSFAPPQVLQRVRVLQFVSQPGWINAPGNHAPSLSEVQSAHGFSGRFFFLPNQFWRHKNHRVVFEAIHLLKQRGIDALVLCTGNPRDYRLKDRSYFESLQTYIDANGLRDNIRILGLIPYAEVLLLMRASIAVLNPSRFEGWSSTVEEARSLGQKLVLSNIPVHLEQDPPGASFFSPDDAGALADVLATLWNAPPAVMTSEAQAQCLANLRQRTLQYGRGYIDLVSNVAAGVAVTSRPVSIDAN
jgi:glycosyltransferase involved in cell wall biosynthesis